MDSVVVSVRIKKVLKNKLEREGIDVQREIKGFLDQKAAQIELKASVEKMRDIIKKHVKPSKKGFAANFVRQDRDAHN